MKLKEIHRTSTFAWSPASAIPLLATGTVAGALDASFSNDSRLEIWAPNFMDQNEYDLGGEGHPQANHSITTASRFNRLAWGAIDATRPHGLLAAGMENGEIGLWDPAKIVAEADAADASILKNKAHDGPVRGVDFNPIAKNLLASGATNGQIFVWDLKDLTSPYSPGGRSSRLDEITALSWNTGVQQILATSSSTGFTVVWDLRGKREVVALSYTAGGGPMQSSRRGQSAIAWHPNNSTRLITASEDDASPVIMLWDLRNARAPEKVLNGHDKGILSLSWCKQDADLLLSCGKDSRTIVWNPQTGENIGELPAASNWAYQVEWCPRDPNILATASFDGAIGIHSLQSTNQDNTAPTPRATDDVFAPTYHKNFETTLSLEQPPAWLKRSASASFGYGGVFVSVSNVAGATGQFQSSAVHLRPITTEPTIIQRAKTLAEASKDVAALNIFADQKTKDATANAEEAASWKALSSLFKTGSRDELIALLGFSKEKLSTRIAEAVKNLQGSTPTAAKASLPEVKEEPREPEVEVKTEPEEPSLSSTPSQDSASSLFGEETESADADFFTSMGGAPVISALPSHMRVPHVDTKGESSAAATLGSPGNSATPSEDVKDDTFQIYPEGESEVDQLVTQALVLGDFVSAVELCLSAERFADAILLAVKGGPELLNKTQKAYFERSTTKLPYLRLYESVASNDLANIVQNADLKEWQEVFVILCTYASQEEFSNLTEQLGLRLEFQGSVAKHSGVDDASSRAKALRKSATLCYLAAGNLEKVVSIWIEEMTEEQHSLDANPDDAPKESSHYTTHAQALQTFVEKVTVFRAAVSYKDVELESPTTSQAVAESGARTYKLAALYDRYFEYADLLATQGLLDLAVSFIMLTPKDYNGGEADGLFRFGRERLFVAAGKQQPTATAAIAPVAPTKPAPPAAAPALPTKPTAPRAPYNPSSYPAPSAPSYPAPAPNAYAPYAPPASNSFPGGGYNPYPSGPAYHPQPPMTTNPMVPPPPPAFNTGYTPPPSNISTPANGAPPPLPAALRKDIPGWNDPPSVVARRTPMGQPQNVAPITNPLPNSPPVMAPSYPTMGPGGIPPPPRSGSAGIPPPPRAGQSVPPPPRASSAAPPPPRAGASLTSQVPPLPGQQFGYGPRPGSVGPPQDARPPSTGPHVNSRYLPPPSQDPVGSSSGIPPPPPKQGPGHLPPPPMRAPGPYAPPPAAVDSNPVSKVPPPPRAAGAPPIVRSGTSPAPPAAPTVSAPAPPKATAPKYPPGDRTHIPESVKSVYQILFAELDNFKKITPKRTGDDVERRMNILFDSLNCATLSIPVVQQLMQICDAFQERNIGAALQIHLQMLTEGSRGGDDITVWMPALKQLCQRMLG